MGITPIINTLLIIIASLENCRGDDDVVLLWSGESYKMTTLLRSWTGNPYVYLKQIARKQFNESGYSPWQRRQNLNTNYYYRISHDYKSNATAVVDVTAKRLFVAPLRTSFYHYMFNNLPLSHNVSGIVLIMRLNLLYWVDSIFKYIGVMQLSDGKWTKVVYKDVDIPYALAAHDIDFNLYFTDIGSQPKIERSTLNGRGRRAIVSEGLHKPIGLHVDKRNNQLFWLDANKLKSVDLRTGEMQSFVTPSGHGYNLNSFSIYKDLAMFGTEEGYCVAYKIASNNKSLSKIVHFKLPTTKRSTSISIGSPSTEQQIFKNPCKKHDCSGICLPITESRYRCICPFGYSVDTGPESCNIAKPHTRRLLVVDRQQSRLYQVDPYFFHVGAIMQIPEFTLDDAVYFSYQSEKFIFYVHTSCREIMKYDFASKTKSSFSIVDRVTGFAVDRKTGFLFIVEAEKRILRLFSQSDRRLFASAPRNVIKSIFIEQKQRRFFYSDCHNNVVRVHDLGNSDLLNTLNLDFCVYSMFIDAENAVAYFGDVEKNLIRYDLKTGRTNKTYHRANKIIAGITMMEGFLYYVDNSNYIVQVNPTTAEWKPIVEGSFTQAKAILEMDAYSTRTLPVWMGGSIATGIPTGLPFEITGENGQEASGTAVDVTFEQAKDVPQDDITHKTIDHGPDDAVTGRDEDLPHYVEERSPEKPFTFGNLLPPTGDLVPRRTTKFISYGIDVTEDHSTRPRRNNRIDYDINMSVARDYSIKLLMSNWMICSSFVMLRVLNS